MDGVLWIDKEEIVTKFLEYIKSMWAGDPTMERAWDLVWSIIEENIFVEDNTELCRFVTIDEIEIVLSIDEC